MHYFLKQHYFCVVNIRLVSVKQFAGKMIMCEMEFIVSFGQEIFASILQYSLVFLPLTISNNILNAWHECDYYLFYCYWF